MNKTTTQKKLAEKWGCTTRTIRCWQKKGAPLDDDGRMRAWLSNQQRIPPGTVPILAGMRTAENTASALATVKLPTGMAAALRRQEKAEAQAYTAFEAALASGDPIQIKATRENWLKISESLRRADLAIEQSRRDAGELVPRSEVTRLLHELHWAVYWGLEALPEAAPRITGLKGPLEAFKVLKALKATVQGAAFAWLWHTSKNPIPAWMIREVTVGSCGLPKAEGEHKQFYAALCLLMQHVASTARPDLDPKMETAVTKTE
jgi:hypothetical protein